VLRSSYEKRQRQTDRQAWRSLLTLQRNTDEATALALKAINSKDPSAGVLQLLSLSLNFKTLSIV
jgi:hypothetical protein